MSRKGAPVHQNLYAWKPDAGRKKHETELGGKLKPYSEITGVCPRCKDKIEWKRKYGKYKPLLEPAKCQRCSKRAVRQAYHNLCPGCSQQQNVCAKCCCHGGTIVGRDCSELEAEQKLLEEAIKNSRERERRTLLRAMNKHKPLKSVKFLTTRDKVGELFPATSLEEYACAVQKGDSCDDDDPENDDGIPLQIHDEVQNLAEQVGVLLPSSALSGL